MRQAGQGAAFLKKAFHAVAESADVIGGDDRFGFAFAPQSEAVGNVFLDRDLLAGRIPGEVHDGKTAERKLAVYRVLLQQVAAGKRLIGLLRHGSRGYDANSGIFGRVVRPVKPEIPQK